MKEKFMDKYGHYLVVAGFILLLSLVCCACQYHPVHQFNDYMGWSDDNVLEEAAEFIIESESGIEIDLSPRSPE